MNTFLPKTSLALLTDLYQLTMAYGYWKSGVAAKESVFHMFFRNNPFKGGFTVSCGLSYVIEFLEHFRFEDDDRRCLAALCGNDGKPLFDKDFLDVLQSMRFSCDVDAMPEGTVVFPHEPMIRVQGPIIQCQLIETALLNMVNFQTLIATKAARVRVAAGDDVVLEFGLRRAQGIDGALAASRAAYVGGCDATSNVLAHKMFGIPVKGTHAHSWVMSFDDEREAFLAYAKAMPNNCVFLVDTYDTLEGVKKAIETGVWLRKQGYEMVGIRLDSGDLAYLSVQARTMLDAGGFPKAVIVASNDLDEHIIASLKQQGSQIAVWGVGTRLVTGYDQPALGGVYKLSAVRLQQGPWQNKVKVSEQAIKMSSPGIQQVRRYTSRGEYVADVIYDVATDMAEGAVMVDPMDMTRQKKIEKTWAHEDLLVPIFRRGRCVYQSPSLAEIRQKAQNDLAKFHAGIKRFVYPHEYPVGLEKSLYTLKAHMILQARAGAVL